MQQPHWHISRNKGWAPANRLTCKSTMKIEVYANWPLRPSTPRSVAADG